MKIVTLIDNSCSANNLQTEHGLSFYIETEKHKIIFDTGQSDAFLTNAKMLGVDIELVDSVIISHAHYDHLGGLIPFLKINHSAKIFLKKEIFDSQYFSVRKNTLKNIGFSEELKKYENRFVYVSNTTQLDELIIISHIEKHYPMPRGNNLLFKTTDNKLIADNFDHELIFVIEENNALCIFSGCAHSGILNIINTVKNNFSDKKIKQVIGGFHLMAENEFVKTESEDELINLAKEIDQLSADIHFYTGHCTSHKAIRTLKKVFDERLNTFSTGENIIILKNGTS